MAGSADRDPDAFDSVVGDYSGDPDVELRTMFRSPGLRVRGKIFAFRGRHESLIVKLPRDRADALVAAGEADLVTMGTRTMKEWVAVPLAGDPRVGAETWRALAREAHDYVASLEQ